MLRVGKIVATHGLNGRVVITHIVGDSNWLKTGDVLFVAIQKDSRIPYFVQKVHAVSKDEMHIQIEEINSVEAAKKLVGKQFYVNQSVLGNVTEQTPLLWIGFEIIDQSLGNLGELIDMSQAGQQWIGTINYNGKEVLLPMTTPLLSEVKIDKKQILMDLPDGLLDI
jgi:16S rRNA processing protein RimM